MGVKNSGIVAAASITHYAHHRSVKGYLAEPENEEQLAGVLRQAVDNGWRVCTLGAQNSFSDVFMAEGQLHISMRGMCRVVDFNPEQKLLIVQPGIRIWQVLQLIIPKGFYLTGLSGSYTDTMGGMISSNSFGKDSWLYGNSGNNVRSLKLMNANGETQTVFKGTALFNAVIAGLGMLGIITEITLELKPLPSFWVHVQNHLTTVENLGDFKTNAPYKYAWLDMSGKPALRGVVKTALFSKEVNDRTDVPVANNSIWGMPPALFWKAVRLFWNPATYSPVNSLLYFMQQGGNGSTKVESLIGYYYPFHRFPFNQHIFKDSRFYEWQVLFEESRFVEALHRIYDLMCRFKIFPIAPSIRWHKADDFFLSFSGNGLSLLVSFDAHRLETTIGKQFADSFFEIVFLLGGKTYLSKYPYFNEEQLGLQYPALEGWKAEKLRVDPGGFFTSDTGKKMLGINR